MSADFQVAFSRNHNGDPLVIVNGEVAAIAEDCDGWGYLVAWIAAFRCKPNLENAILAAHAEQAL